MPTTPPSPTLLRPHRTRPQLPSNPPSSNPPPSKQPPADSTPPPQANAPTHQAPNGPRHPLRPPLPHRPTPQQQKPALRRKQHRQRGQPAAIRTLRPPALRPALVAPVPISLHTPHMSIYTYRASRSIPARTHDKEGIPTTAFRPLAPSSIFPLFERGARGMSAWGSRGNFLDRDFCPLGLDWIGVDRGRASAASRAYFLGGTVSTEDRGANR